MLKRVLTLTLALTFTTGSFAQSTTVKAGPEDGQAVVENLLARMPSEDSEIFGLIKIRPADGSIVEIPVKLSIRAGTNAWQDIYEAQPVKGRPGEVLVVQHRVGAPNEYLHWKFQAPALEPALKPVARENLSQPFAGSDFYFSDLGLEFLHWPSQKFLKKEMRKGRSCRVIESTRPQSNPRDYSRVLSWIDADTGNIIMAEGYDAKNKKLKEFSVRKISRSDGKAQLKEIEIRNDQTDSRTRLEFNLEIKEN